MNIEKVYEQILQSMAGDFRATAQFLSCGGPGAGALTFSPRTSRAEMDDKSFIVAARLRIGIPLGAHVTHCHKSCDDNICGAELDELQTHALICQLQGSTVHRHNRIRDSIAHILRENGQYNDVQIEQLVPEATENSVAPRMDIIAHGPLSQRDLIDVTVACAHTSTALRCGSGTRMGVAAHMLEINKYRKYPGVQVTSAALESGGRPGDGQATVSSISSGNSDAT